MRQTWSVDLDSDRQTVEYRRPWWAHRGMIEVDVLEAVQTRVTPDLQAPVAP
jgi:hypothetical protein